MKGVKKTINKSGNFLKSKYNKNKNVYQIIKSFYLLLFGCPTTNFGSLSKVLDSLDVNHCVSTILTLRSLGAIPSLLFGTSLDAFIKLGVSVNALCVFCIKRFNQLSDVVRWRWCYIFFKVKMIFAQFCQCLFFEIKK